MQEKSTWKYAYLQVDFFLPVRGTKQFKAELIQNEAYEKWVTIPTARVGPSEKEPHHSHDLMYDINLVGWSIHHNDQFIVTSTTITANLLSLCFAS